MRNIIYIDRNYLYFYGSTIHAPVTLQFLPTTVKDMELLNYVELEKQIDTMIKTNKIVPDDTGIAVAHQSSFEKLIDPKVLGVDLDTAKKKFLDSVPFEEIIFKEYPTAKGLRLVAVNKELIYAIKEIFQERGFRIVTIASMTAIYPENDVPFNTALGEEFIKKSQQLSQGTFPVEDIEIQNTDVFDESNKPLKNNNRLYLMIGVFVVLIGTLVAVLLLQKPAPKKSAKTDVVEVPIVSPTTPPAVVSPTETIAQVPTIAPSIKTGTKIQILNGSGVAGQADQLKKQIEDAGYTTITTGNASTLQASRSQLIFKPNVSQEVRQEIAALTTKAIGEISIQENAEITSDVVITTAQTGSAQPTPTP